MVCSERKCNYLAKGVSIFVNVKFQHVLLSCTLGSLAVKCQGEPAQGNGRSWHKICHLNKTTTNRHEEANKQSYTWIFADSHFLASNLRIWEWILRILHLNRIRTYTLTPKDLELNVKFYVSDICLTPNLYLSGFAMLEIVSHLSYILPFCVNFIKISLLKHNSFIQWNIFLYRIAT